MIPGIREGFRNKINGDADGDEGGFHD